MKLIGIESLKNFNRKVFHQIVYEWEDILSDSYGLPINDKPFLLHSLDRLLVALNLWPLRSRLYPLNKNNCLLSYEMTASFNKPSHNSIANKIPIIIDFWVRPENFSRFFATYNDCPLVLISNKEAFKLIKNTEGSDKFHHLALSISHKYRITSGTTFNKIYDLVLAGRENSFLIKCLAKYCEQYPDFEYVDRKCVDGKFLYITNKNRIVGQADNRKDYIDILRASKIAFYATPGIDDSSQRTFGYNPVTPRFLEFLASGCHVLTRYPKNEDTTYFELSRFCPSVETYIEFEKKMNTYLNSKPDMQKYSEYLDKHYTSVRADELREILLCAGVEI